jgi:hypothetical protein
MKLLSPLFLVLVALCLAPPQLLALGHHQSGIVGQTAYRQNCDLSGCVPIRMPMRLFFYDDRGRYVTDVISDADGFFEVALKPGLYTVAPYFVSLSPEGHFVPVGLPVPVIVEKKEYTALWLHYVPRVQPTPPIRPPSLPPPPPLPMPR